MANGPEVFANNFDGIVRNVHLSHGDRLDLCFVEVKPARRPPFHQSSSLDRAKIVRIMKHALNNLILRRGVKEDSCCLVVFGIVCCGLFAFKN